MELSSIYTCSTDTWSSWHDISIIITLLIQRFHSCSITWNWEAAMHFIRYSRVVVLEQWLKPPLNTKKKILFENDSYMNSSINQLIFNFYNTICLHKKKHSIDFQSFIVLDRKQNVAPLSPMLLYVSLGKFAIDLWK